MDINYYLPPDDPLRRKLEDMGVENSLNSEYILMRKTRENVYLPGKRENITYYLEAGKLIYAESLGHDVLLHMPDGIYSSSDRLKQLETILDSSIFLRISNSCIVNRKEIRRIESTLLQKFILHLSDGSKVDVTRSYYYIFRDRLGI